MTKVSALTELTSISYDDGVYMVDDMDGSPASRKGFAQTLLNAHEINPQTGTTYTLALTDRAKTVTMSNTLDQDVTIPANATVAFPIGTAIIIRQINTGATSITAAAGVTLDGTSAGSATASERYKAIIITKVATNTWYIDGAVGAVA